MAVDQRGIVEVQAELAIRCFICLCDFISQGQSLVAFCVQAKVTERNALIVVNELFLIKVYESRLSLKKHESEEFLRGIVTQDTRKVNWEGHRVPDFSPYCIDHPLL